MDEEAILRALQAAVRNAVLASSAPTLPISYVMVDFDTPEDGKWLELVWTPNNVQGDLWGDEKTYRGILRMILHWPNDGAGVYRALAILGSISEYFPKGAMFNGVQVYEKSDLTGIILEGDEALLPVTLRYQSYRL